MGDRQSGFTLVELIVTIVILGILAAVALPKFSNLGGDARAAKMKGAVGAISAANVLAHATQLAQSLGAGSSISMDGVTVTMFNAYPDASGITVAANLSSTDFPTTASGTGLTIQPDLAHTGTTCTVGFALATSSAPPTVTLNNLNTTSCL